MKRLRLDMPMTRPGIDRFIEASRRFREKATVRIHVGADDATTRKRLAASRPPNLEWHDALEHAVDPLLEM